MSLSVPLLDLTCSMPWAKSRANLGRQPGFQAEWDPGECQGPQWPAPSRRPRDRSVWGITAKPASQANAGGAAVGPGWRNGLQTSLLPLGGALAPAPAPALAPAPGSLRTPGLSSGPPKLQWASQSHACDLIPGAWMCYPWGQPAAGMNVRAGRGEINLQ